MADEITLTASLSVSKPSVMVAALAMNISNIPYSMSGNIVVGPTTVLAPITTGIAVPIGQLTALGWAVFFNSDQNNSVVLSNGLSGAPFAQIPPQGFNIVTLYPTCAPFMVALIAPVYLEYMIISR